MNLEIITVMETKHFMSTAWRVKELMKFTSRLADAIFELAYESDSFYYGDEWDYVGYGVIPEAYILKTMEDPYHVWQIKELMRREIFNDLSTDPAWLEDHRDVSGRLVYRYEDYDNYSGLINDYIATRYKEEEDKDGIWVDNRLVVLGVKFKGKRYEVQLDEARNSVETVFPEHGDITEMALIEYEALVAYVQDNWKHLSTTH